jgi:hypothetical protein
MKTRGGWRETPQSHEIAVKPASEMTVARIQTDGQRDAAASADCR